MHVSRRHGAVAAAVLLLFLALPISASQADYAGVLRVVYSGVEVRRVNTSAWIPLAEGAEMPFGSGDSLRTTQTGRALFDLVDAEILILPETVFGIEAFGSGVFRASVQGRLVYRASTGEIPDDFRIAAGDAAVVTPAEHFSIQAEIDQPAMVVVAEGAASTVTPDNREVTVSAGFGLRASETVEATVPLDPPAGFSRLVAALDGCPGTVQAVGRRNLNVRVGPSLAYDVVGTVENGTPVSLLAISADGNRYRIQYLAGFGWILASGVQTGCEGLPVMPLSTLEHLMGPVDASAEELEFLIPFFGTPAQDEWFYHAWYQ